MDTRQLFQKIGERMRADSRHRRRSHILAQRELSVKTHSESFWKFACPLSTRLAPAKSLDVFVTQHRANAI